MNTISRIIRDYSLFTEGLVSMRNGFSAQRITLANFKSLKMYLNSIPPSGNFFNPAQLLVGINRSVNTEQFSKQGWRQEISDGGMNLPTRGLNTALGVLSLPKISDKKFFTFRQGANMFRRGAVAPSSPPLALPLLQSANFMHSCSCGSGEITDKYN